MGRPRYQKVTRTQRAFCRVLFAEGKECREIAKFLSCGETSVKRALDNIYGDDLSEDRDYYNGNGLGDVIDVDADDNQMTTPVSLQDQELPGSSTQGAQSNSNSSAAIVGSEQGVLKVKKEDIEEDLLGSYLTYPETDDCGNPHDTNGDIRENAGERTSGVRESARIRGVPAPYLCTSRSPNILQVGGAGRKRPHTNDEETDGEEQKLNIASADTELAIEHSADLAVLQSTALSAEPTVSSSRPARNPSKLPKLPVIEVKRATNAQTLARKVVQRRRGGARLASGKVPSKTAINKTTSATSPRKPVPKEKPQTNPPVAPQRIVEEEPCPSTRSWSPVFSRTNSSVPSAAENPAYPPLAPLRRKQQSPNVEDFSASSPFTSSTVAASKASSLISPVISSGTPPVMTPTVTSTLNRTWNAEFSLPSSFSATAIMAPHPPSISTRVISTGPPPALLPPSVFSHARNPELTSPVAVFLSSLTPPMLHLLPAFHSLGIRSAQNLDTLSKLDCADRDDLKRALMSPNVGRGAEFMEWIVIKQALTARSLALEQ